MKLKFLLRIILLCFSATAAIPTSFASEGVECKQYSCVIDNTERIYLLYLPNNINRNTPLVFVLHGYGATADMVTEKGFGEAAEKYGFAVCYPQGTKDSRGNCCWNVGYPFQEDMQTNDISFLCKLAEKIVKEYKLSRREIFCTGMSNGGEMCYLLAYAPQKTFKAVAPIAGLTMAWMPEKYARQRSIPLFELHGTEDRVSEWNGDPQNAGGWGAYLSVPDAISYWTGRNGCSGYIKESLPLKTPQSHRVISHKYFNPKKKKGKDVWLYEIVGGVHSWANEDINTAEEIWKFFSKFVGTK